MTVFQDKFSSYLYVAKSEAEAIDMYTMSIRSIHAVKPALTGRFAEADIDWLKTNHLVFHEVLDNVVHYSRQTETSRCHIVDNIIMPHDTHDNISLQCLRYPWVITVLCDYYGGYLTYPEHLSIFKKAVKRNDTYPDQMIDVHFETESDYLQAMLMK